VFFLGGKSDLNCGLIKGQPRVFKKWFGSEIFEELEVVVIIKIKYPPNPG
jgi:hypothetical protein